MLLTPARCQEKMDLVDSPFFLPGVTQYAATFEPDEYGGAAFRVMGSLSPGVRASFDTAANACSAVGMGLAGAMTPARKAALDAIVVAADAIMESDGATPQPLPPPPTALALLHSCPVACPALPRPARLIIEALAAHTALPTRSWRQHPSLVAARLVAARCSVALHPAATP